MLQQDYVIFSVEDSEPAAFILEKSSAEDGGEEFIVDKGDNVEQ